MSSPASDIAGVLRNPATTGHVSAKGITAPAVSRVKAALGPLYPGIYTTKMCTVFNGIKKKV